MSNICFPQKSDIIYLNDLAMKIDPRLYFFAYYTPKLTVSLEWEHKFWIIVTNLYSLYHDCGYPIRNIINDIFGKFSLLTKQEFLLINNHITNVENLRKFFCHNFNEQELYFDKLKNDSISKLLDSIFKRKMSIRDLMSSSNEAEWECLYCHITNECEIIVDLLKSKLLEVLKSTNINNIKMHWINQIANWYPASFVDGVLNELYNLKALSNKYHRTLLYSNTKNNTIKHWKEQYSDTWKQRYPYTVKSMNTTAYPNDAIKLTVYKEVMFFTL